MTATLTLTKESAFWDKLARRYAKQPVADEAAYAHTLERTRSYLGAEDAVLEMGCGTGSTALKLADAAGSYLATDFSPEMIDIAREKAGTATHPRFEVSDARLPGLAAGQFDAVLAFSLLHLVPDLTETLKRAAEVLKPGGYLISKTPCLGGEWYFVPLIGVMRLFGKAPRVAFLRPDALDAQIRAAGFDLIETVEHNKGTRGHFVVARKL